MQSDTRSSTTGRGDGQSMPARLVRGNASGAMRKRISATGLQWCRMRTLHTPGLSGWLSGGR
ncbi:hypothetical protein EYF80_054277 [Liparis tanakae]|uniref:Uncharacterized protein n=1 Tax=Liparis tanakae TaxID=230148 RepID=A0A4Z2F4E4_9TELE|nr:hypothetical protein EYF80_054277 [Liparis tanakae]